MIVVVVKKQPVLLITLAVGANDAAATEANTANALAVYEAANDNVANDTATAVTVANASVTNTSASAVTNANAVTSNASAIANFNVGAKAATGTSNVAAMVNVNAINLLLILYWLQLLLLLLSVTLSHMPDVAVNTLAY